MTVTVESVHDLAQPNNSPNKAGLDEAVTGPHGRGPGSSAMDKIDIQFLHREDRMAGVKLTAD
jgi:hypothetical protein